MTTEHQTLTEAVEQAERESPTVWRAAGRFDEAVADMNYRRELHKFRPLPWDPEIGATDGHRYSPADAARTGLDSGR
jgi:hypothetical protein